MKSGDLLLKTGNKIIRSFVEKKKKTNVKKTEL